LQPATQTHTAFYPSGNGLRSRSVSPVVLTAPLGVPAPSARLWADWQREVAEQLCLEPGDVECLPLARARARWPDYRQCVQAVADWTRSLGLHDLLPHSEVALMACRGARYHHDGAQYGDKAFCNLFLSADCGLDLHFAASGQRMALAHGTAVLFDTGQPHAVVARQSASNTGGFSSTDFADHPERTLVFLSWELPIENPPLAHALGIVFDTAPIVAARLHEPQLWVDGTAASVCPASGCWL
jgi:hypothetical protein